MQAYDHNMRPMGEPFPVDLGELKQAAEAQFEKGAKAVKVTTPEGQKEIMYSRDYREKSRFLARKYQPHQGAKEMARRRNPKSAAHRGAM